MDVVGISEEWMGVVKMRGDECGRNEKKVLGI